MLPKLTIIFGYRDREPDRVRRCLDSLDRQTTSDFYVNFVDYGSSSVRAQCVRQIVESYAFCHYMYADTRGYPWNRSHALNIGCRIATTDFLVTSDIDMVFANNFVEILVDRLREDRVIYCAPHFLPEGFRDWHRIHEFAGHLPMGTHDARGGCQCMATKVFHSMRGFDEYYRYWGVEDRDMAHRLQLAGLAEHWISDEAVMFHQWHAAASAKTARAMPVGLWSRMQQHYCESAEELVRNGESWGQCIAAKDRPIFDFLDFSTGCVRAADQVVWFEGRPDNNWNTGELIRAFWDLPSGHILVVPQAGYPDPPTWLGIGLRMGNWILRMLNSDIRIDYTANLLHSVLVEILERNPNLVKDYFLDFSPSNAVSFIMRR